MYLYIKKIYSYIRKTKKSYILNIFIIATNLRKIFTIAKSYTSNLSIVATIKILSKDKIFIIVFIVNYSKNIKTKYNFCN